MNQTALYRVRTWDVELQKWTPQVGLPPGPFTLMGLRWVARMLRTMGYTANYGGSWQNGDPSVLVERVED